MQSACRAPQILAVVGSGLILAAGFSAGGDALDSWTSQIVNHGPTGWLVDMAYGNGVYVVSGAAPCTPDFGTFLVSTDALHWTISLDGCPNGYPYGFLNGINAITFATNTFVAVGYLGMIYTSTDGVNWTARAQAPFWNFDGIAYGNGRFVAVGDGQLYQGSGSTTTNVYLSRDGIAWSPRDTGLGPDSYFSSVAYGNSRFVAIGNTFPYVYSSTIGVTWTPAYVQGGVGHIYFCNGQFIMTTGVGTNTISTDGTNWTTVVNDSGVGFSKVVFTHGVYLALSPSDNRIFTSTNLINWAPHTVVVPFPPPDPSSQTTISGFGLADRRVVVMVEHYDNTAGVANAICSSDSFIELDPVPAGPGQLKVSGLVGAPYRIDCSDALTSPSNSWQSLTTFALPSSPYVWTDLSAANLPRRFYRAVLLP